MQMIYMINRQDFEQQLKRTMDTEKMLINSRN